MYGHVLEEMDVVDVIVALPRDGRDNPDDKVEMTIVKLAPTDVNETSQNTREELFAAPNTFSGKTQIHFKLARPAHVGLSVYNSLGHKVSDILQTEYDAGLLPLSIVENVHIFYKTHHKNRATKKIPHEKKKFNIIGTHAQARKSKPPEYCHSSGTRQRH